MDISDGEETVVYRIPGRAPQVHQSQRPEAAGLARQVWECVWLVQGFARASFS